jgi:predicted MFS family arabinose efflux permease
LAGQDDILSANTMLSLSNSAALAVGPGLGGLLLQVVRAPFAILMDAASFLVSAAFLASVHARHVVVTSPRRPILLEAKDGLVLVRRSRVLLALAQTAAIFMYFYTGFQALLVLFFVRILHLSAGQIGLYYTAIGVGFLVGTAVARRVTRLLNIGPAMILGAIVGDLALVTVAFVHGSSLAAMAVLVLAAVVNGAAGQIYMINSTSLRQASAPLDFLGRVNGVIRVATWTTAPIGALCAGFVGDALGVRTGVLLAACGLLFAPIRTLLSPIRSFATLDDARPPSLHDHDDAERTNHG